MIKIKRIIRDVWSSFVAALILTWFFRHDYASAESEGNRDQFIQAIDIGARRTIFSLVLAFVVVVLFLSWPPGKGEKTGHYKYTYPENANRESSDGIVAAEGERDTHKEDRVASAQDQNEKDLNQFNKEKRDVNAQEGMWRAANALVMLTYIQVFIGLGTMIFLVLTFRTQRRELRQAERAAGAAEGAFLDVKRANLIQFKPYFKVTNAQILKSYSKDIAESQDDANCLSVSIFFELENIGVSPARDLSNFTCTDIEIIFSGSQRSAKFLAHGSQKNHSFPIKIVNPQEMVAINFSAKCFTSDVSYLDFRKFKDMKSIETALNSRPAQITIKAEATLLDLETSQVQSAARRRVEIIIAKGTIQGDQMPFGMGSKVNIRIVSDKTED